VTLLSHRSNIYSQNGEDGVIGELLRRLGLTDGRSRWCVEFGAWDGKHLSNTFNLVKAYGWNAVYIEGNPRRFQDLAVTASEFKNVHPIQAMVGGAEGDGFALDDILSTTDISRNYDLLSIDIDSSDLEVWVHHTEYRPSIVVIEINSSLEPGVLQWHGGGAQGNSFSSTLNVAVAKGYTLVCHTGNLIFVKNELVDRVGLNELDLRYPERLFLRDWVHIPKPSTLSARILRFAFRTKYFTALLPKRIAR
jgi:hypothetical protein